MTVLFIVGWLLVSFTGWLAVVKYMTMPCWEKKFYGSGYQQTKGLDLSWCECFWLGIMALLPFSIPMNLFWAWVLRQKIQRRPLIKRPNARFPKCSLPKCPVAIRGIKP